MTGIPCEYPECQCTNTGLHTWILGRRYICPDHGKYFKLTNNMDYFGCHESLCCKACGIKDRSGIWYTKRRCVRFEHMYMADLLYINKNLIINYYRYSTDFGIGVSFYGPDIHVDWYVRVGDVIFDYEENFHSSIYPYTYKGRLYEMRLPELYLSVIPRDILDEVIKYL